MDCFTKKVSAIKEELQTLEEYTTKLDQKTREKATNVLDHQKEHIIIRDISAIEQIFKEAVTKVKNDIEKMHRYLLEIKKNSKKNSSLTYSTQNTHCNALTKRLTRVLNRYRNVQVDYRNREEHRAVSQFIIENPGIDSLNAKNEMENSQNEQMNGKVINSAERNQRVKKLAESIGELCMMIDELHEMVKSQDCVVDRIEINMDETLSSTERAVKYLRNALIYQTEATRLKRILILVLIFIVFMILVYITVKTGSALATYNKY